ncbi:MAG TPA: RHS repeat-associated core domain-containing protein [Ktedonobacteraceae bacterium]|nr:RHS repeat-associated core domain-containing protein [Ktedonobacteraceae bacterium]
MLTADQLAGSVNAFSGTAAFSVNLLARDGDQANDIRLPIYYNSNVWKAATTWNMAAPTSVLGLGWGLGLDMIIADHRYAATPLSTTYYLISAGNTTQLICTANTGSQWIFEAENYAFWKISYEPARELWQIIKEDGVSYIFGDSATGRNTVSWGVAWNNWIDSSSQLRNQVPIARAWNLSQVVDLWGNTTTFTYQAVTQYVGTPLAGQAVRPFFTQASYLVQISAASGESAVLHYDDKDPAEYQDPHTHPAPPNAYQDHFETRCLSSVDYLSTTGQILFTTQLLYTDSQQHPAFLGSGNLTKRLLTGIKRVWASGQSLPDIQFHYYGQDSADGVSATNVYNAATHAFYGALHVTTLPEGGTVSFHYGSQVLSLCEQHVPISTPVATGYTFSNPRFAFADDFVVVSWYGEQAGGANPIAQIVAWTWDGRWLQTSLDAVPLASANAYPNIPILIADDFFGVLSGQRVYLYHRHPDQAGQWISPVVGTNPSVPYFTISTASGETTQFVAGDRFAAVLGVNSGKLARYRWNGQGWVDDGTQTLSAGSSPALFAITARFSYLFASGSASSRTDSLHLTLFVLDQFGTWQTHSFTSPRSGANLHQLMLQPGQSFVVQAESDTAGPAQILSYRVFWWDTSATTLNEAHLCTLTFSSGQTPYQAIAHGSTIAIGQHLYRFDGLQWQPQDLSQVAFPDNATLSNIAYGFDQVLRSVQTGTGTYTYDLVAYDPNTATWAVPAGMSATGTNASVASRTARTRNRRSDFLIFNGKVYCSQPDNSWAIQLSIPDSLSGDDLASLQLLESRYLLYQNGSDTKIYLLSNGTITNANAAITLTGQKILVAAATPDSLVGNRMFVTYTGTYGSSGSQLTLYRVASQQVSGTQTSYSVTGVLINNGYQSVPTGYSYEVAHATIDAAGLTPQFNQVTQISGSEDPSTTPYGTTETYFFNGLNASEPPVLPYPADSAYTNAPSYYSRAKGMIYSTRVKNATGTVQAATDNFWMVYSRSLGQVGVGLYARLTRQVPMLDAVTGQITNTYSTETGLPTQTSERNYNSAGSEELLIRQYKYFWEEYDPNRVLNLLTPIIQTTARTQSPPGSNDTVTSIEVVTWKQDWGNGPGQWSPWQSFRARNGAATFTQWQGEGEANTNWLLNSTIQTRTITGLASLMTNVDGVASANLFDASTWYVTARFTNASIADGEASYYGFELYEQSQGWGWTDPNNSLQANITTTDNHTGTRCLRLPPRPGEQSGPINVFQPLNQQRAYVFSCWVKSQPGFDPANGVARWQLAIYRNDTHQQIGSTINLDIPNTNNKWLSLQKTIDLAALRTGNNIPSDVALYVVISAYNQNTASACQVDNLRLSAINSSFGATVYQPDDRQISATLGNNGETDRFVYDAFSRRIAHIGPGEKVKWVLGSCYARDLGGDAFLPDFPNNTLQLQTTSDSAYYDFHDGNIADWSGTGGTWAISGGELTYTPSTPPPAGPLGGSATLNLFAFTNFAVRVVCHTQPSGNAGIGNGDVFIYWNGSASQWVLARQQNNGLTSAATSQALGFGSDWIFAIVEGVVIFFVNGVQLFSYTYSPNTSLSNIGKPALTLKQNGSFDDLFVLNDPQLAASFLDGLGNLMQRVEYVGSNINGAQPVYPVNGSGILNDALGRPAYQRTPLSAPLQLALAPGSNAVTLLQGNQDTYLFTPQGTHLTIQQYLAGQGGVYNYSTSLYENSPLGRISTTILPRETTADAAHFSTRYNYLSNTASGPGSVMQDLLPSGSDNRYYLHQITDTNGVDHYTLRDQAGRIVARRTTLANNTYHTTFFTYDSAGNLTTVNLPNYYAPPGGSQAAVWQQTQTFDFFGRLSEQTTPNAHTVSYLYDDAHRLRFEMTAEGAAQNPARIRYFKYDQLGREVESGYIQDATYQWGTPALQNQVNNQSFPNVDNAQQPAYAQGQWYQKNTYDASPNQADLPNLLGRLFQTQTNHALPGVEIETFRYDAEGNIITQTCQITNFDTAPYTVNYRYNNLNYQTEVDYPSQNGNAAFKVAYYYNRLGQLASIGDTLTGSEIVDPTHPADAGEKYYAAYAYNELGDVASESLNNGKGNPPGIANPNSFARTYDYTPQGWLSQIDDPYFTETLNYYQGSGNKYYNGNVAGTSFTYKPERWDDPPADYRYDFTYDHLNRLTQAHNSLNDAWSMIWGPANQPGFDANNNMLQLQQGATTTSYHYAPQGENQSNDQVKFLSSTATTTLSFSTLTGSPPPDAAWSWGANNGGISSSAIVTDSERGKALKLTGGSLGHYEYLRLQTYLDPAGSYTLSYQVKTEADFTNAIGQAAWLVRFSTPAGEIIAKTVAVIAQTGGTWSAQNVTIDIPTLRSSLGLNANVTSIVLECVNYLRPVNGSGEGPALYLSDPSVSATGSITSSSYDYDKDGNVIAAPTRALTNLAYNPVTGLTDSITLSNGNRLLYINDGANLRSLELYRNSNNTNLMTVRTLRSYDGQPLMRLDSLGTTRYIFGPTGLLACQQNNATNYLLRDHLGSIRSQVESDAVNASGSYAYLPFGGLMRESGEPAVVYRYTGQEFEGESGLYNYNARLYDPDLKRFLSVDALNDGGSPYVYVENNPLNQVDPTGNQSFPLVNSTFLLPGKSTALYEPVLEKGASLEEWIKYTIFSMRSNFHELNPIPRQDLSLWEWLYHAPSWIYLPYIKISPTEAWTVAIHFGLSPIFSLNPLFLLSKSTISSMYATVYRYLPTPIHLPWLFFKKVVLRFGYTSVKAYYALFQKFLRLNQEARDFRKDLSSDVWVKNAYRHAYWICRYTQEWGADFALATGYAHEYAHIDLSIEGPYDSLADKINNLIGAKLGLIAGGNCGALVNQTGNAQALAWAKSYAKDPLTQLHKPTEFNIQKPLDFLWRNYAELPRFDASDLNALRLLNITLPSS